MCGIAYILDPKKVEVETIKSLIVHLDKVRGGDGVGVAWFEKGKPFIYKGVKQTIDETVNLIKLANPDNGVLFHTRMASMGEITDGNCHPFLYNNSITCHNGHVAFNAALKLLLMENSSWTKEKALSSTDSEVVAFFIDKYGFEISEMFSGVIATLYPDKFIVNVNGDFESVDINGTILFASEFPETIGFKTKNWIGYNHETQIEISDTLKISGSIYNAKEHYLKKKKKGKGKYIDLKELVGYE